MIMANEANDSYISGSDLLLKVADKAVGHCTSHTTTLNSETKDRAVKPVATAARSAGLFKNKGVTGLSISISFEGLRTYTETENGFEEMSVSWGKGQSVVVEAFKRDNPTKPYLKGKFVIASLEETSPAGDDATWRTTASRRSTRARVAPGLPPRVTVVAFSRVEWVEGDRTGRPYIAAL